MKLNIVNGKIVTADSIIENGTLKIEGGKIADIIENGKSENGKSENGKSGPDRISRTLDAKGEYILPGIIDIHGDDLEGAISPRPSTRFPIELALLQVDRKYAACGITTKLHALSYYDDELKDRHAGNSIEIMEVLEKIQDDLLTDHFIHVRCEIGHNMEAAFEAIQNRFVKLVAVMDHAPGQGQFNDPAKYIEFHKGAYNLNCRDAIRSGAVDVLCSDYYPASLLYSIFLMQRLGLMSLTKAARMVTLNVAKAMGMEDTIGSIEMGKRANLVVVSGKKGIPVVTETIVDGKLVYSAGGKA
jgi:alpha-D-ribose 1-methylphosphonate 5-triphosphate diphosphatase PhnM